MIHLSNTKYSREYFYLLFYTSEGFSLFSMNQPLIQNFIVRMRKALIINFRFMFLINIEYILHQFFVFISIDFIHLFVFEFVYIC